MTANLAPKTLPRRALPLLAWIDASASVLISLGLGCWIWLVQHRDQLPSPEVRAGKTLLKQYQATSHDIFLALLSVCALLLLVLIRRAQHQQSQLEPTLPNAPPAGNPVLRFARAHPLVLALFAGYTVAMVHGTNWMYPELVGWYRGIPDEHLLNNFSFRQDFLRETMRRDDYRFFPLAHQDLHILSWFTAYVKVWMLVSAAELFTVVVVSARFVRNLSGQQRVPALLFITSLLLLFHPATGMAFFQFPYCERFLTFIFALYCGAYLRHHQQRDKASFYAALLFGLIGIFIKDIAVVLFVVPPALMVIAGSFGLVEGLPSWTGSSREEWAEAYRLELWLCSFALIFLLAYVVLSLLPSAFANKGSYNENQRFLFRPDWRFGFLISFCLVRVARVGLRRSRINLLDGLNLAALTYATGLLVLIGFESHKYLTLPVQWVTVLDLCFAWTSWISPALERRFSSRLAGALGSAVVLGTIGIDHLQPTNFRATVGTIKDRQQAWLEAYQAIDITTAPFRNRGDTVNLIYSNQSWFTAKRHLGRLKYDRLIEFNPKNNGFLIEEGIQKGEEYTPQTGDFLFSIDAEIKSSQHSIEPENLELLHQNTNGTGEIYRIK
jgi:hypothetical protein